MKIRYSLLSVVLSVAASVAAAAPPSIATMDYTFDQYMQDFGKVYETRAEQQRRQHLFENNLAAIVQHNTIGKSGHKWTVNQYTDRQIPEELPLGLVKQYRGSEHQEMGFVQYTSSSEQSSPAEKFYQDWMQKEVVAVSDLPKEVDWRTHNPKVTTAVKDQGMCGSCWAFASTAVLESHVALKTGQLYTMSPQELVSCVENPDHCGGSGGCSGATYDLAFDYAMDHGMVLDSVFPYKSGMGRKIQCSLKNSTMHNNNEALLRGSFGASSQEVATDDHGFIDGAVATIDGYVRFPTNNYTVLMNAVAKLGPIGVTVAASRWAFYSGGIFDLKDHNTSSTTDVNHAVVLEGYGVDQESQELYWLVRNSWGPHWGEDGYIRLKRVDPTTEPDFNDKECGMDISPADGSACTKDDEGNDIVPEPVKVCGNSAILYETFVPVGGKLLPKTAGGAVSSPQVLEQ